MIEDSVIPKRVLENIERSEGKSGPIRSIILHNSTYFFNIIISKKQDAQTNSAGRFLVVEGGMNDIALWNTHFQRYLKITSSGARMPETSGAVGCRVV